MDTQALRTSTVNLTVPKSKVREVQTDLRNWKIKHFPFSKRSNEIEIRMYPNPKTSLILLKYS